MIPIKSTLFPFPHWLDGEMHPGSALPWPIACLKCKHTSCKFTNNDELQLCSYGYNFQRLDKHIIIAGIIVREYSLSSQARSKRMNLERNTIISKFMLESAVSSYLEFDDSIQNELQSLKENSMQNYIKNEQYKTDFLKPLRDEIQKGLSFVHDYKQINTQIRQNINVIIESKYDGTNIEEKLAKANREEKAIYESSKFLDEKLQIAKFLMHPEWLEVRSECVKFRFHGAVLKYRRIYASRFEAKNVHVSMQGKSFLEIIAHPQATSVIPHTFIDNAAKYSPKNGRVEIYTQDEESWIRFEVSSFGPRILPEEKEKIFQPFYRTPAAIEQEEEGAGYGLYLSQLIATQHLGSQIEVQQDPNETQNMGYWTTFGLNVPLQATIL